MPSREDAIEDHEDHRSGPDVERPPSDDFRAWLPPESTCLPLLSDFVRPMPWEEGGPLMGKSGGGFEEPEEAVVAVAVVLSLPSSIKEIRRAFRGRKVEVLLFVF